MSHLHTPRTPRAPKATAALLGHVLKASAPYVVVAALVLAGAWWLWHRLASSRVEVGSDEHIAVTQAQIDCIRAIGQWELLTVSTEELVDTLEPHWYGNREWTRIYAGTLRIGVDLKRARSDWFSVVGGDSAVIVLPEPGLLDAHFIDEARTRTFDQQGSWDAAAADALYQKAARAMRRRALTPANLNRARAGAVQQMEGLARALGLRAVSVTFEKEKKQQHATPKQKHAQS